MKGIATLVLLLTASVNTSAQPALAAINPGPNETGVAPDAFIVMTFTMPIDAPTVNSQNIFVHGCQTGRVLGVLSGGGAQLVTFTPNADFKAGETISVSLTSAITSGGIPLTNPQVITFTVGAKPGQPAINATGLSITAASNGLSSIAAGDIDGDGDIDVLTGSLIDNKVAWQENDGGVNPTFTTNIVSTVSLAVTDVALADIDGDGSLDLLRTSQGGDNAAWFQNNGAADPVFTGHVISSTLLGAQGIAAGDIDNDGDMDVITASFDDDKIAWHENNGAPTPGFTGHVVTTSADGAYSVAVGDLDGDGDLDILSAALTDDQIAWHENDGAANPSFTSHPVSNTMDGATDVVAADLDGDGDVDIVATSSEDNKLAWFENNGNTNPVFTGHVISTGGIAPSGTAVSDLDGDGDLDILRSSQGDNTIAWFENDGSPDPAFSGHVVSSSIAAAIDVAAADLDGDDRIDIISAAFDDDEARWFETQWQPRLLSTTPSLHETNVDPAANITLHFDAPIDASTVNGSTLTADGVVGGSIAGILAGGGTSTITFDPAEDLPVGDVITLAITAGLENDGNPLFNPQNLQFTVNASGNSPQLFSRQPICDTCGGVRDVEIGDINGDGHPDLVTGRQQQPNVLTWHLNNGAVIPDFSPVVIDTTTATSLDDVELADLDGDGDLDILTCKAAFASMVWYENDGSGTPVFTQHVVGTIQATALRCADMDSDGDMDFVMMGTQGFTLYRNDGSAQPAFSPVTIYESEVIDPTAFVIGDVNGDGHQDVVGATDNLGIQAYLHNGAANPEFNPHQIGLHGTRYRTIAVGDLDGDGDLDLVYSHLNQVTEDHMEIGGRRNNGGSLPSFNSFTVTFDDHALSSRYDIHVADLNGDGHLDIVSSTREQGNYVYKWYPNKGEANPGFITSSAYVIAEGTQQDRVAVADLNGDGDLELVTSSDSGVDNLAVYDSRPGPRFVALSPPSNAVDVGTQESITMTFNEPMEPASDIICPDIELVAVHGSQSGLIAGSLQGFGTEHITFVPTAAYWPGEEVTMSITRGLQYEVGLFPAVFPLDSPVVVSVRVAGSPVSDIDYVKTMVDTGTSDAPTDVVTGDINGDGHLDIVVASEDDAEVWLYRSQGLPWMSFSAQLISSGMAGASGLDLADMDGDGDLDILVTAKVSNKVSAFVNQGGLTPTFTETVISSGGNAVTGACVKDLNGDGALDVVRASLYDNTVTCFMADGISCTNGLTSYSAIIVDAVADSVFSVDVADLDGDGDQDILAASFGDDRISWYENDGSDTPAFTAHTISASAGGASDIATGDLDGDGDLDVLATAYDINELAWYENDGAANPGFVKHVISNFGLGPNTVAVSDIDGDGDLDVFRTSDLDDRISWFENDGSGNFTGANIGTGISGARGIAMGDLDGDGDIDVLTTSHDDDELIIFEVDSIKETEVRLQNGLLTVLDINGGSSDDRLQITQDGDSIVIHDPANTVRAVGPSVAELNAHTVVVHNYSSSVGAIHIDGISGLDSVLIDFTDNLLGRDVYVQNATYITIVPGSQIATFTGAVSLQASQKIEVFGGVSSSSGNITLEANWEEPQTPGNFSGITVFKDGIISSESGDIILRGRGGNSNSLAKANFGVYIRGGTVASTGTGPSAGDILVEGVGGLPSGAPGYGIYLGLDVTPGALTVVDGDLALTGSSIGTTELLRLLFGQLVVSGSGTIYVGD